MKSISSIKMQIIELKKRRRFVEEQQEDLQPEEIKYADREIMILNSQIKILEWVLNED